MTLFPMQGVKVQQTPPMCSTMKKNKSNTLDRHELRLKAEERFKISGLIPESTTSPAEMQRILYELPVQQIELELQYEQLQHAYDQIQQQQQRFTNLYNLAPVAYLRLAPDSTIIEANKTIESILSVKRSDLIGARLGGLIAQKDLPAFNDMIDTAFQTGAKEHCEITIGNIFCRLDALIIDNAEECCLTIIDISDTRRAKEALKHKEAQYRSLFEASQEGILILDYKSGKIVDANPYISHLTGFSFNEIVGKELWKTGFFLDKALAQTAYLELQSKSYNCYSNVILQEKSGRAIAVEFISYVFYVGDEKAIQCNIRDIIDHNRLRDYENTISKSHKETIHALSSMVEVRDSYTTDHQKRVAELSVAIAKELKRSPIEIEGLQLSSILHDIGKFNIPAKILVKSAPLTEIEKDLLRNHAQAGYDVLKGIHFPWPIAETVLQHHERLDGSGYPNKLKSDSIREEAKILGVADTVDAMTGSRPYRPAGGIDKALQHIQQERGKLFDPLIVDICVKLFEEKKFNFSPRPDSETIISPRLKGGIAKRYNSL